MTCIEDQTQKCIPLRTTVITAKAKNCGFERKGLVPTGVAQSGGHHSAKPKATGSIPARGTQMGCGLVPIRVCERGNQSMFLSHMDISLPLFLPPSLSLSKNKQTNKKKTNT